MFLEASKCKIKYHTTFIFSILSLLKREGRNNLSIGRAHCFLEAHSNQEQTVRCRHVCSTPKCPRSHCHCPRNQPVVSQQILAQKERCTYTIALTFTKRLGSRVVSTEPQWKLRAGAWITSGLRWTSRVAGNVRRIHAREIVRKDRDIKIL